MGGIEDAVFKKSQVDKVKNLYFESVRNALLIEEFQHTNGHVVPSLGSDSSTVENISPTYAINIDSYLKDKKAESQLATVTKEIDAMEDEDVVFKKSQVDKVKNLYFESVSNALLKEEPHDVRS